MWMSKYVKRIAKIVIVAVIVTSPLMAQFQLPFSDDFNDGDDSDWLWYTDIGPSPGGQPSHQVVNGVERIVTHDQNNTLLANGASNLSNYYVEADMRITQLLDDGYGGLRIYAYANGGIGNTSSYYVLDICHRENRWGLGVRYSDGSSESLAHGSLSVSTNHWYHMKLEVRGDTVFAYLDGQMLGWGVPSQPLSGGYFGFGGSDDVIEVDNVHADASVNNVPSIHQVPIYHSGVSQSYILNLISNDGAGAFQSNFNGKVFVYKFTLIGGGGYYSSSLLKINFNHTPVFVIGKGTSDDTAAYRVSIGVDTLNMYGFNERGWVDLTSHWTADSIFVLLNSKWGTNYDTELDLWMAFSEPLDTSITYDLIRYNDSFDTLYIHSYQVYVSPVGINISQGNSFSGDLSADNASSYMSNFAGNYAYRIEIWGGGGDHSDCLLKMYFSENANYAIAIGNSDANDNNLRTGVGREVNHLIDVQQEDWVNVTGELHNHYVDFRLNSKWGTNQDSHIILWLSTNNELQDVGYSISMFPEGLGSISIKEYSLAANSAPVASVPTGPSSGNVGQSLTYHSTVTDPDGDNVCVQFDWGDGTTSNWSGYYPSGHTFDVAHSWNSPGTYHVRARGKDSHGNIGNWSSYKTVTINQPTSANDTLKIVSVNAAPGSNITVPLNLINPDNVGGVQFDIIFDHNVVTFDSVKLTSRASGFTEGHNLIGADTLRIMIYTTSGDTITSGAGEVANIYFTSSQSVNFGDSTLLDLTNTLLSSPSGQPISVAEVDGWIRFMGRKGDVNQDGNINIFDVVRAVNIALQIPPPPTSYELWAADMNDDGTVNVFDVIQIVNVVLSGGKTVVGYGVKFKSPDTLRVLDAQGNPGSSVCIPIELVNSHTVGGLQFKLHFDSTILSRDSVLLVNRVSGMTIGSNVVGGDTLLVLVYSTSGDTIPVGSGVIINAYFTLSSTARGDSTELGIYNPLLSDRLGQPIPVVGENGWLHFGQSATQDTLRAESQWGAPGTVITVPFVLTNHEPVAGIQTTAYLDSSILHLQNVTLDPAYTNFSLSFNNLGDSVRIVVLSMSGDSMLPSSDTVFYMSFLIDSNATLGDSTYLDLGGTVLSDPHSNPLPVTSQGAWIYIRGRKGDLNQDGVVNITDAVREVNIIIGRPPEPTPYERWAGDMNDDGLINVVDAVAIINVILGRGKGELKNGTADIWIEDGKIFVNSSSSVAGVQFDIIGDISYVVAGRDLGNLRMFANRITNGYRVVIIGLDGSYLSSGKTAEVLKFAGGGIIENPIICDKFGNKLVISNRGTPELKLYGVTPNPLIGSIGYVSFALPHEMNVNIDIFDVTGRLVKEIVTSKFSEGEHKISFNAGRLSSGVYFLRFIADRQSLVRKFVVE